MEKEPIRILRIITRLNIGGPAIQAITLSELFSKGQFRTRLVCGQVSAHEGDMSYLASSRQVDPVVLFVRFSVAGNIGKVLDMLLAPFLGKPIPLLPLQLLWLNLLTDGLLGLGMGV